MEVKESKGIAERYERMARELAIEAHCRYCDHTSVARTKCARDVEDGINQIALALERAAVEARRDAINWTLQHSAVFINFELAALRKRLEELKEGGR